MNTGTEINAVMQGWTKGVSRPDWTVIGKRVVIGDGVSPNQVFDGYSKNSRILGAFPHYDDITTSANVIPGVYPDADGLRAFGRYKYGCRWRVTDQKGRIMRSAMKFVDFYNQSFTLASLTLTFQAYAYPPQSGATWTVKMEIYRSKFGESQLLLYRIPLTTAQDAAIDPETGGSFTDATADGDLVASDFVDLSLPEANGYFPPCNFMRNWNNRLVMGGAPNYALGKVSVGSGDNRNRVTLFMDPEAVVREVDRYARLKIVGQSPDYTIDDVRTATNRWIITPNAVATGMADYYMWRDQNIYIGNPLPDDPESYTITDFIPATKDDTLTGIGTANGYCYIFWSRSIAVLQGQSGAWQLVPMRNGVGCASHATISDRHSDLIFFYAGEHGVWLITGGEAKKVSAPIDQIFATQVNHAMDKWAHGMYDPTTEMYFLWVFEQGAPTPDSAKIADLLLVYDTRNGEWYAGNIPAVSSAVLPRNGRWAPCVGLSGHVAELKVTVNYDGYNIEKSRLGSAFATTSTVTGMSGLPTDDNGLQGIPVCILDANQQLLTRRIIASNTTTAITIHGTWGYSFTAGTTYYIKIGWIYWYAEYDFSGFVPASLTKLGYEVLAIVTPVGTAEAPNHVTLKSQTVYGTQYTDTITAEATTEDLIEIRAQNATIRGRAVKAIVSGVTRYFNRIRMLAVTVVNKARK